jgi:hypothetical protein
VRLLLIKENGKVYEAFGLTISSDFPLPELIQKSDGKEDIDVLIKVNNNLKNSYNGKLFDFVIENQIVTVQIPEVGVFQVKDGRKIIVSPYEKANEDIIRLYILGSCFGALLLQRGIYPLHGSAIAINGKAYAIVGDSGAGKSTLASALMERGYHILSDDVIAVTLSNKNKQPIVIPSYPQQKLWQQSLDAFGLSNDQLRPIYGRENKFCIPVVDQYHSSQLPLGGIFELAKTVEDSIVMQQIQGLEQLQKLYTHTYRQFLIPKMQLSEWHFNLSAALAEVLPFYQIRRPSTGFSAFQIVEQILTTIDDTSGQFLTKSNKTVVYR